MKLVCPHCGGDLYIELEDCGSGYYTDRRVGGIECYGDWRECGAVWDRNFEPITPSKKELKA